MDLEGEQRTSKAAIMPHLTLAILKFWQGTVEIILRAYWVAAASLVKSCGVNTGQS